MSYKYSKGAQVIGDLKAADDAERNTLIDFGEDQIEFQTSGSTRLKVDNNGIEVTGSIKTTTDIVFSDNAGTFPTAAPGFYWDLNNDEARMYATQPASDQIDFVFKLSDNNGSSDRYMFWVDDYRGGSYDRYPLVMHGDNVYLHSTETSEGVPDLSTAKINIPRGNTSATTTVHKGRVQLQGDNSSDLYIRFTQNSQNGYIFQDQSDSNALKIESHTHLSLNTNGANERLKIASAGGITFNQAYTFPTSDGTNGQVLQTDGAGNLSFATVSGGAASAGGPDGSIQINDSNSLTGSAGLTYDGTELYASGSVRIVGEEIINDPEYATTNQSNRSFTLKRHYNFSNVSANTWHDVISFQPYLHGTTNNPGANTFWASIGMKIEIAGHTSGIGNGYRSRTAYVSYNGSSADSGGSSDITLGSTNVSTRLNLSGWSTTVQINPNQVSATGFTGTVYVEIHFSRGAGSNGENVTWSVT